jgi:cytochrome c-type biogenesis protein CcmH
MRLAPALFLILALGMISGIPPAGALSPEEQLDDPVLEERARDISKQLRCLVCQNQSIDDSDADLARDLRGEVRSLVSRGMSDGEVLARIRDTYGDYVLLNPPLGMATALLWATPFVLVLMAGAGFFAIQRRASPAGPGKIAPGEHPAAPDISPKLIALGIAGIVLISAGLYASLGRPGLESRPLSERRGEIAATQERTRAESASLDRALAEANAAADADPSSVENQLRLAMLAAGTGDSAAEINALDRALALTGGSPAVKSLKAEALSRKADGLVTIPARQLIAEVLAENPEEPRALYLHGLSAYQDEDYEAAFGRWTELQAIIPPEAPLAARLAENIADAAGRAGVPVPEDTSPFAAAADLSEEERAEMIRGMVEGLEARLADAPDDPAGWDRLIRSYQVLGDVDGLARAVFGAARAFPDSLERQVIALDIIMLERREADYIDQGLAVLDRINAIAPGGPDFLFFAGFYAAISGERELAIGFWEDLAAQMNDDDPLKAEIKAQIEALKAEIN